MQGTRRSTTRDRLHESLLLPSGNFDLGTIFHQGVATILLEELHHGIQIDQMGLMHAEETLWREHLFKFLEGFGDHDLFFALQMEDRVVVGRFTTNDLFLLDQFDPLQGGQREFLHFRPILDQCFQLSD